MRARLAAALAFLSLPWLAAATDFRKLNASIQAVEIIVPDLRFEHAASGGNAWVLSWPLVLGGAEPVRVCERGNDYHCPASSSALLGGDLFLEPQVKLGSEAAARILAGATLHVGWTHSEEHQPRQHQGPALALQGGGLLGRDGNGTFAGVGLQWASRDRGYTEGLAYGFGLWLRAIRTREGDRVEVGLDLLEIPWLLD